MLEITNLSQAFDTLDGWFNACEELAEGAYRGMALAAYKFIVDGTPQWSGNLVASWVLTVGAPAAGYSETVFKAVNLGGPANNKDPFSRRRPNTAAIHYAKEVSRPSVPLIRLGAPIFVTNVAPYAEVVEVAGKNGGLIGGRRFLRDANLPVLMVHAAEDKYGSMGEISEAKARGMAQETL